MPRPSSSRAPELITSRDNPVVRHLLAVARRREPGLVLLEGPRVVGEAKAAGATVELLALRDGESLDIDAERVVHLAEAPFKSVSQTETPQGVLAVARAGYRSLDEGLATARDAGWPLIVLDGVQDPGNVGTIIRTAVAAGAPAVALMRGTADAFAPKAVRASAGNVLRLCVARATWEEVRALKLAGAAADASTAVYDAPLDRYDALVLGSEAHGLSSRELDLVSVPMAPGVESLNVAAAAAVILFELRRRRSR